ncbi:DUF488 domain-containing protein [Enterococcus faecalis]
MLQTKRVYETPSSQDGYRILIDRLWPRGKTKAAAAIDEWLKEVAPSVELRQWFHHDPEKFPSFKQRYQMELQTEPTCQAVAKLNDLLAKHIVVTLVYGAKDPVHNHAVVLKEWLEKEDA